MVRAESQTVPEARAELAWQGVIALEREAGQRLFGYAVHMGIDHARAADLVQEALLRLWRELERGVAIGSPQAWTFRTLGHLAADEHRLLRRTAGLLSRLRAGSPLDAIDVDPSERVTVWAEVERLPLRQRQVMYLRFRADLPFEEIATVMGITPGTARMHASLGLSTLRRRLGVDTVSA